MDWIKIDPPKPAWVRVGGERRPCLIHKVSTRWAGVKALVGGSWWTVDYNLIAWEEEPNGDASQGESSQDV